MKNSVRVTVLHWDRPEPMNTWEDPIPDDELKVEDLVKVEYQCLINLDDVQSVLETKLGYSVVVFKNCSGDGPDGGSAMTILSTLDEFDKLVAECYA